MVIFLRDLKKEKLSLTIFKLIRFKDGVALKNSDNILIETKNKVINSLSIKEMNKEASGNYTIKARNEIGQVECSFSLRTDGKLFLLLIQI